MKSFGLDFVRIGWEYPTEGGNNQSVVPHRPNDIANYLKVLQLFRQEFAKLPWKAELSVASPAGSDNYRHWDFTANCGLQDHINIMTYDLAGDWSAYTDHQAKLYKDPNHPAGKEYSVHGAVQDYIKGGCPSDKIVMGIPAYGRSFEGTSGLYGNFTKPTKGSYTGEPGIYDPESKLFITYESPKSLAAKLDFIKKYNLGGTMYWSGDADAGAGTARSLITKSYNYFGKEIMACWKNNINYPDSRYPNVREGSSPSTTKPVTTKPTTTKATTTTAQPVTTKATPSLTATPLTSSPTTSMATLSHTTSSATPITSTPNPPNPTTTKATIPVTSTKGPVTVVSAGPELAVTPLELDAPGSKVKED
ncbi:hypothetical protein DYB36_009888 [Aphanomyces astaci]|uniref:GH18 domain-containing protein n=1 Tax=Aphanomyces astaci TaxID=112090 RepID=A0A397BB67_APHAT|nr:hypothetical protein DYB36_009888 [Aphanomyces astaci]